MFKKISVVLLAFALLIVSTSAALADKPTGFDEVGNITSSSTDNGFDEFGYNNTARIFSGTTLSWCMAAGGTKAYCETTYAPYAYDKLVMKWNAEWDRGNDENWSNPPYAAWENNEYNGKVEGGSGEVWHYKIVWVGACGADYTPLASGGYCIWGQFATIMDMGTAENVHIWLAHGLPSGYGSALKP